MKRPTWDEFKLLFEDNRAKRGSFVEKHSSALEGLCDEGEEILSFFDVAFSWVYGIIVDWREYEEDLVRYFSETLDEGDTISADFDDNTNSEVILYNGQTHLVPLTLSPADRYIVIRALRDIMKEKYSFKLFTFSYMSDTHGFLLLPAAWWEKAESLYPDGVKKLFMDITDTLDFP